MRKIYESGTGFKYEKANAQYDKGWRYFKGDGVTQSYDEAVKCFRMAAELGDARAQNTYGWMLYEGLGVKKDCGEAVKWYKKAVQQRNAMGQCNLGWMFQNGFGVTKDLKEAERLYRLSAEQGCAKGQINLGWLFMKGYGVKKDYSEAVKWFKSAANEGNINAKNKLQQAMNDVYKSAQYGNAEAQFDLGNIYYHGCGERQNDAEAIKWYIKAAEQGNIDAISRLKYLNIKIPELHNAVKVDKRIGASSAQGSGCLIPMIILICIMGVLYFF